VYLPFVWRGWHDFGGGAIGDMGCYSFDTVFRVLKLEAPAAVEAKFASDHCPETYPKSSQIEFEFAARGAMPPVKLSWYDGGMKPEKPAEFEGRKMPDEGLLFVGDKGSILCGFTGGKPVLLPESKMKSFQPPPKTLPRSPGNEREWLDACKGGKGACGANFEFSAGVTEAIQLGNVATHIGRRLEWDKASMKATPAADKIIRPEYRQGWTL
jgi:predicted dehydrogenase